MIILIHSYNSAYAENKFIVVLYLDLVFKFYCSTVESLSPQDNSNLN